MYQISWHDTLFERSFKGCIAQLTVSLCYNKPINLSVSLNTFAIQKPRDGFDLGPPRNTY